MKRIWYLFCIFWLGMLQAQDVFTQQQLFFNGAPTLIGNGTMGLFNPANSTMLQYPEWRFFYSQKNGQNSKDHHWGMAFGMKGFSMHYFRHNIAGYSISDYQFNFGNGNETFAWGSSLGFSTGDKSTFNRSSYWGLGFIFRPNPYLSAAVSGFKSFSSSKYNGLVELGIRPLGTEKLMLMGNYIKDEWNSNLDDRWGAGISIEPLDGLKIYGIYFDNSFLQFGMNFSIMGMLGFNSYQNYHKSNYQSGTYELRLGGGEKSALFEHIFKDKYLVKIHLKGHVDYQKFVLFDNQTIRFKDLLDQLDAISTSRHVQVIAINLSGFSASRELIWELRQALQRAQNKGKKIVIYFDNADLHDYYLASVADFVVMDPLGTLTLNGLLFSKTYLKGTLDKLGLGVDEWRFFKYKSAYETLSRKDMSKADSTQLQDYINDIYETYKKDIAASRPFSEEDFDTMNNDQILFLAEDAIQFKLADTTGRWIDIDQIISQKFHKKYLPIPGKMVTLYQNIDERWSEEPKIAIVYGLGACAMDTGIKARFLEKVFEKLRKDKSVKGIVFRVDSPGGDALASDLVTEAINKTKKIKPVVVSQGYVAGSGGYWISMSADKIFASPFTITGSIGVIGGWIYDRGLTSKFGLTADKVQIGKHADLGFGPTIPLINATIPYRNLTPEERGKVKDLFLRMYGQFVKKVAKYRNLDEQYVRKIGEGHIYSGIDGKEIHLVDELGDLYAAVQEVKKLANIPTSTPVDIIEIPKYKGLFKTPSLFTSTSTNMRNDARYYYLTRMAKKPMIPFPMTPAILWSFEY